MEQIEISCFCCCEIPKDKRNLKSFERGDKHLYEEFTGGLQVTSDEAKICVSCKESLKLSLDFLILCKNSYKYYTKNTIDIKDIQFETIELYETTDEIIQEDQDDFDEEDNLTISEIKDELVKGDKKKSCMTIKKYFCDFPNCEMKFTQPNALKCHKRTHSKERPYICEYCDKSFSQNTTLKTHVVAKHTGKTVHCTYEGCDKKFARSSFLKQHIKRDHQNLRDYVCSYCEKSYKQKSHLDRHIDASHMNIRYQCNKCEKSFSKSWSLKMHLFTHSEADNFPYKCIHCKDEKFQRRDKWLKHMKRVHPKIEIDAKAIEINVPKSLKAE